MTDNVPLKEVQRAALQAVYAALRCTDESFCPNIDAGQPCPVLPRSQYSARLECRNGDVTQLALYYDMNATNARTIALQQQGGFGVLSPEIAKAFKRAEAIFGKFPIVTS